jgi:assimilatory nitrate reductase catalytic subunit
MTQDVRTTCPYCGVGCGVLARVAADGAVTVTGDPGHPANVGRLCSKGAALGETVGLDGRLLHPEIGGERCDWTGALALVAARFQSVIRAHGPEAVAFYVSGQLLTEDYYVANKLMKGFIGSANIDTNSRLCMSSTVAGYKRAFGADTVPCSYEDLERAKLIVLAGSNTAWCHPVLFQRIARARKDHSDLRVVVIDPRRTDTCDIADLHLPIAPGLDTLLFNGLLVHLAERQEGNALFIANATEGADAALAAARADAPDIGTVAARCGLAEDAVRTFYDLFARTERTVTVFSQGINQFSMGTDKVNSIINCHLYTGRIGRPGMGPFSFTGQPNAMGGREVGGLSNQLAAHMELDDPAHRARVQRFWDSPVMADRAGLKAVELFRAVETGRVKALWIMATNPAVSLPDSAQVRRALQRCEFLVVSDCVRHTDTTAHAHVLLPAQTWGEKDGTVTNSERCVSRQRAFLPAPGEARPDWWIVSQVARRMGFAAGFDYASAAAVFREHAALSGFENGGTRDFDLGAWAHLPDADYAALQPRQWPVPATPASRSARPFADGRFYTDSGRARLVAVHSRPPAQACDSDYPLVLNTGRVRDHWHTLTRTGKSPRLSAHRIEPYAELHPDDARRHRIEDGGLVSLETRYGQAVVRAKVTAGQRPGSVFVPMHWNAQFSSLSSVGLLVNPDVDPISGQPEFKHTPLRIRPQPARWYGFVLTRRRLTLRRSTYWACARGTALWRYEIAGDEAPEDWAGAAREVLCAGDQDVEWVEFFDRGRSAYRAARIVAGRLESCVFIGPTPRLPARDWLQALFETERLDEAQRRSLLTGRPPTGERDGGRIVCACFSVGINTLTEAIRSRKLASVEAVGAALRAGTNCGSCVPELKALLAEIAALPQAMQSG